MQKEQQTSTPLVKSFAEAVANSAGNQSLHQHLLISENFFWPIITPKHSVLSPLTKADQLSHLEMLRRRSSQRPIDFPLLENFHMEHLLARLGIQGAFTVSMINSKHTLISLSSESDYSRLWLRRIWFLQGFPMRIFKWTPTFTPTQESSVVPIWVCFPELPAHLFGKEALFSVASMVGSPLQIDALTLNKSKLSQARVCVEIDLLKPIIEEFDLHINGVTIVQKVVYEYLPEYCSLCKHVGHKDSDCFSKGNAPKPPPRYKINPRLQQFAGIETKQARDRGKKRTVSVGHPTTEQNSEGSKAPLLAEEAERSIADQPENGDKDQQENDNQAEQIQSHGKQGHTSHTTLTPQGENGIVNMETSTWMIP
ncbi:UNVERIFIED_CONTAM: hypothetical protein Sindi_2286700 [Sesamum indicum]